MNIPKTKNTPEAQEITFLKAQTVECVETCKYLGAVIDSKLTFEANWEERESCQPSQDVRSVRKISQTNQLITINLSGNNHRVHG